LDFNVLSDIIVHGKYAQYLPDKKRRETWEELVDRNRQMHLKKYPDAFNDIINAYDFVNAKKVLPSARSLQFAGRAIELNNARMFNCSYMPIESLACFSEAAFLLLSGCGVGFSVQAHHIAKLPPLYGVEKPDGLKRKKRYIIADSIEGWADAFKALIESYFHNTREIDFDYSAIRKKGSPIKTSGGKAPGPEPLRKAITQVIAILETAIQERGQRCYLKAIECHDIMCTIADCIRSGGIRRSALISLFDADDIEMLNAKSGEWYIHHPQRALANNSAVMVKREVSKEKFLSLWDKAFFSNNGEPGIFLTNDKELGANPCQPGWATVLTPEGLRTFDDIGEGSKIWSKEGWTTVVKKWSTGVKPVYAYHTDNNAVFYGTKQHKVISMGEKIEANDADFIDCFGYIDNTENPLAKKTKPYRVLKREYIETCKVYDIMVDNESHTYWTGGCNVSNCCEVSLPAYCFCNLVEINGSVIKTQQDFNDVAKAAAVIGTLQAGYTNFHYLRDVWRDTTEDNALIGVGITGIASKELEALDKQQAAMEVVKENKRIAALIGIKPSKRCTTVKPSGTTSLVLGTSSGIHAWHDKFYLRRVTLMKNEPLAVYLSINHPEIVEASLTDDREIKVIVPQKAPDGAITRHESVFNLLDRILSYNQEWIGAGHVDGLNKNNVSCTVSVRPEDWPEVKSWLWENRESYHGITIFPASGGNYVQTPFEPITEADYLSRVAKLKPIDLRQLIEYDDNTDLAGEVACSGGACEIR
jgi:hypothetical protein